MKTKFFIFLMVLGLGYTIYSAQDKPCQCYCSVKCGPRDVNDMDEPFYDEEHGVCFCSPRDKALYTINECQGKNIDETTCCRMKEEAQES